MALVAIHQLSTTSDPRTRRWLWRFACACVFGALFSSAVLPAHAQRKIPLLFGENKNQKGELIPVADHFLKVLSSLEKELDVQFQLQIYPWNRAVKLANDDGGLIFGMSLTPEREAIFSFSEPILFQNLWLVTCADREFPFESLSDLKGKVIGVVRGSRYGGEFDQQKNRLFKIDDDIDASSARLKKLLNRRIDALTFASPLSDAKEVEKLINEIDLQENKETLKLGQKRFSVLSVPVLQDGLRFAILRGKDDTLLQAINQSLHKFQSKNTGLRSKTSRGR